MARSKSSKGWLQEHFDDPYVKLAKEHGYRSRASYKLLEIQHKDKLLKKGMSVIDLGAAPGSWSQVVMKAIGNRGRLIACDILPMDPIDGVEFIQGDFTEDEVYGRLVHCLDNGKVDLVISDMAPNMSGMNEIDQPKSLYLAELALDLAKNTLKCNGSLLVKVFSGEGFDSFLSELRLVFKTVKSRKPKASRSRSREIYLLACNFKDEVGKN